MPVQSWKTPTEEYLRSMEHLAFCARFGPSNRQIEKGSMVGLHRSHGQSNDEETGELTVVLQRCAN